MFTFHEGPSGFTAAGNGFSNFTVILIWVAVFAALVLLNEVSRRWKWSGFFFWFILPVIGTVTWFTVLKGIAYTDWFHLAKYYSSTAGCIFFWCFRYVKGTRKDGTTWELKNNKIFMLLIPAILAINIFEACSRDFQVAMQYWGNITELADEPGMFVLGGPWNIMNGIAGILNAVTIAGWFGVCVRKKSDKDSSRDMIWPDMMWFWIVAYDLWNFAYTYNCLPSHAWYCGLALLLAPTTAAFLINKGAWLENRARTLSIWCFFAQCWPMFQDEVVVVNSTYNPVIYNIVSALALIANVAVFVFMIYKSVQKKKNPWTNSIYDDMDGYKKIAEQAEA